MIDPLTQAPILDMFMGVGQDPASKIFAELKRKAEEARAQAQAQNPGAPVPPVDYAGLMEKATRIAAGEPPEATLEPERVAEAGQHVGALLPGETAGIPDSPPRGWRGLGRVFQGEEVPADAARQARFRGMTDAGVALLGSAGEGNLGRGLAQGLSAFQGGMEGELEGFTERRRRRALDDLSRRSTEESIESSRAARGRAESGEERAATTFEQSQEERRAALQVMREQLREIEELAGADSPEVDRARALVKGGPALRDDLDKLHERLIARERFPEDRAMETEAEIERLRRLYEEDPRAAFERAMELRRLEAYERNAGRYGGGGDVTATTMLSTLNRLAEDEFNQLLLERGGPTALRAYQEGMAPAGVNLKELRIEAEERAFEVLERQREGVHRLRGTTPPGSRRRSDLPARDEAASGARSPGGVEVLGGASEGGEADSSGAGAGRAALQIRREARAQGIEVTDEDLEKIRRDLAMGASPDQVRRQLGIQ